MSFGITPEGFVVKTHDDIRSDVEAYQKANIDEGLDLEDESPLSQFQLPLFAELGLAWQTLLGIYHAGDPDQASEWQLDKTLAATGTVRSPYTKTVVKATVTMAPDKALPANSIANLTNRPNSVFYSLTEVPADPSGGDFEVDFVCGEFGAIVVTPGQLSEINTAVEGWLSVTNVDDGITGSAPEKDSDFRAKGVRERALPGTTTLRALIAKISALQGVTDVAGYENDSFRVKNGVPGHYFLFLVRGGQDQEIADTIYSYKAATGTYGTTEVLVTGTDGEQQKIRFSRPTENPIFISATVRVLEGWNGDTSLDSLKARIAAYCNGLRAGYDVVYDKLKGGIILDEPFAYRVTSLLIGLSDPPLGSSDIVLDIFNSVVCDVANIDIVIEQETSV